MNLSFPTVFRRSALLIALLAAVAAPRLSAVTITTATTLPNTGFGTPYLTSNNPTLGTLNFTDFATLPALSSLSVTLTFSSLDTAFGNIDYNNIVLSLGSGGTMYNTGILLNGFTNNVLPTETLSFTSNINPVYTSSILSLLNSNSGLLDVGIIDLNGAAPSANQFFLFGGSLALTLDQNPVGVPFTPVQTVGFGLIALAIAWRLARRREWPQLAWARLAR